MLVLSNACLDGMPLMRGEESLLLQKRKNEQCQESGPDQMQAGRKERQTYVNHSTKSISLPYPSK